MDTKIFKGLSDSQKRILEVQRDSSRYHPLGITANPFPAGGLAPSNPQIEPYIDVRNDILNFLKRFLETSSSQGLALLGGYGTGKTYHLNYIRVVLESSPFNIKIVHVVDPGIHPYHLIRNILLSLGEEEVATMIWGVIAPYLKTQLDKDANFFNPMLRASATGKKTTPITQQGLKFILSNFDEETWADHRTFLSTLDKQMIIDREKLLATVVPVLTDRHKVSYITNIAKIAEDLAAICIYDGIPALERWKALTEGVGPGSIQPGNEKEFLTALLHLLKINGVEYFVLLLDEFEKVPQLERMTDRDARLYLDTLRMLIDAGHERLPFAYIVGTNLDAWELALQKIVPLQHRFSTIHLPTMINDEIAKYTIQAYLAQVRPDNWRPKNNLLHPFPEDFLDLIPANARATARQLVKLCHLLIELTVENQYDLINEDLITFALATPTVENDADTEVLED